MENIHTTEQISPEVKKAFDDYVSVFELSTEDLSKSILDVGAGKGYFVEYLRNVLGNNQSFGVELNSKILENRSGAVLQGDAFNLPFADDSFDIVTSKDFLPMFIDDLGKMKKLVDELLRVSRVGGKVLAVITTKTAEETQAQELKELSTDEIDLTVGTKERISGAEKFENFLDELKTTGLSVEVKNTKSVSGTNKVVVEIKK
jgi:ubiquinone/menaquinone biosynthesis C-methylase UbiE